MNFNIYDDISNNKILDYDSSIEKIKNSDIIIYQNIKLSRSLFCNTETISQIAKKDCRLIQIPSIYLIYDDYDNSIKELRRRETLNNVDVLVFDKFKDINLLRGQNDPKTLLFMEIIQKLCLLLNINFFKDDLYNFFMQNDNFMGLL